MRSNVTSKGDTIQSRRACLKYMLIKVHLDQFILINNAIPSNYQNDEEYIGWAIHSFVAHIFFRDHSHRLTGAA